MDLDRLLVQRAVEANASLHPKLSFAPLDLLGPEQEVEQVLQGFLEQHGRKEFDLICVFRWVSKISSLNFMTELSDFCFCKVQKKDDRKSACINTYLDKKY